MLKIGFLGGGKMAQSMAKGFIASGLTKGENVVASCHPQDPNCAEEFKKLGSTTHFTNEPVVEKSDVVFLAVKPSVVPTVLKDINKAMEKSSKLLLSVAMGVTINFIEQGLAPHTRVMRVMPNTPCLVRQGASVFVKGTKVTEDDLNTTKQLLESIGICEEVGEGSLDAITALSGSGPAYVYVMIEALADGGVKMGLPRDLAYKLASQTVLGAGHMVKETHLHPGLLKDDVTSPAGSTAAGLHFLEKKGFRAAIIGAVEEAANRVSQVTSKMH